MPRLVNSTFTGILTLVIQTVKEDGSISEKTYRVNDMMSVRYIEDGEIKTVTGRLSYIDYHVSAKQRKYSTNPNVLRSYFSSDVKPITINIDRSTDCHSDVVVVPCADIIEDKGVKDVAKMNVFLGYGVHFKSLQSDDSIEDCEIFEGQYIPDLKFMPFGHNAVISGDIVAISHTLNLEPIMMYIRDDNGVTTVNMQEIKEMGDPITPLCDENSLIEAIASDAKVVCIGNGHYTKDLNITHDVTIRGPKAGVFNSLDIDHPQAVLDCNINLAEGVSLHLDGVALSGNASITSKNAEELSLKFVEVKDLVPHGDNSFIVYTVKSDVPIMLEIDHCTFYMTATDDNGFRFKNALELTAPLANGSIISNNCFGSNVARNNLICIYNVDDYANIYIKNNFFEHSANAVRVGCMGDPCANIIIEDNVYTHTDPGEYAGFLLIQPYGNQTIDMSEITIFMNRIVNQSDEDQLYYTYCGENDTQLGDTLCPRIVLDGVTVQEPKEVQA